MGLLNQVFETTLRVVEDCRLEADAARQQALFQHMLGFVAVLTGADHAFDYVNEA